MSATRVRVRVRQAICRDLPAIVRICNESFAEVRTVADFEPLLSHCRGWTVQVAENAGRIVGCMVLRPKSYSVELVSLAVDPCHRRRGIGTQLMGSLVTCLCEYGRTRIGLHVRETNLPAQKFLAAMGFTAVHVRRQWWPDTGEDSYRFSYSLMPDESVRLEA